MTPFAILLDEAFPNRSGLPSDCDIVLNIEASDPVCSEIVSVVTSFGERGAFISRIRRIHPTDRPHSDTFDDQLWEVMAEGTAFTWAARTLGKPMFTDDNGKPDLYVTPDWWIEAKRVGKSLPERQIQRRVLGAAEHGKLTIRTGNLMEPHPTLLKKFDDGLRDAMKKVRPEQHHLAVFFELAGVDFGTSRRQAFEAIENWCGRASWQTNCAIVVVRGGFQPAFAAGLPYRG